MRRNAVDGILDNKIAFNQQIMEQQRLAASLQIPPIPESARANFIMFYEDEHSTTECNPASRQQYESTL